MNRFKFDSSVAWASLICSLSLVPISIVAFGVFRNASAATDATPLVLEENQNFSCETFWVAFGSDVNSNPPSVFGGKIFGEMDRCAAIAARRFLFNSPADVDSAVTVAVNNLKFVKGVEAKDLLSVTAAVENVGDKSITMRVKTERLTKKGRELCCEGEFVFAAYDTSKKMAVSHGMKR